MRAGGLAGVAGAQEVVPSWQERGYFWAVLHTPRGRPLSQLHMGLFAGVVSSRAGQLLGDDQLGDVNAVT